MSDDEVMDHELDCVKFARAVADRDVVEVERLRGLIPADVLPLVLAELLNESQKYLRQAQFVEQMNHNLRRQKVDLQAKVYELREILHNRSSKRVA